MEPTSAVHVPPKPSPLIESLVSHEFAGYCMFRVIYIGNVVSLPVLDFIGRTGMIALFRTEREDD